MANKLKVTELKDIFHATLIKTDLAKVDATEKSDDFTAHLKQVIPLRKLHFNLTDPKDDLDAVLIKTNLARIAATEKIDAAKLRAKQVIPHRNAHMHQHESADSMKCWCSYAVSYWTAWDKMVQSRRYVRHTRKCRYYRYMHKRDSS